MTPTAAAQAPSLRQWAIIAYFCISLGLNNGFILGGLIAFDAGFLERLDISAAQLKLRDSITFFVVGLFAFATGALVDRFGALRVLIVGHCLFMVAFVLLSQVGSIEGIYAAQGILGLCQLCSGYLVCVIAISRLVSKGRGLAIGLMMASTSLANAILPGRNAWLIENFGPQTSLLIIAGCAIPLILGALWIMRQPRVGQNDEDEQNVAAGGPTLGQALRRLDFWAIVLVACTSFFSFTGLVTNLALYAGAPPFNEPAIFDDFLLVLFLLSLITQSTAGWLADRFAVRPMHVTGLLLMALSAASLAVANETSIAIIGLGIMGLGWGLNYVFVQISIPARFAGAHIGRIFGVILIAEAISGGTGPYVFGRALDAFGTYQTILFTCTGLLIVGAIAANFIYRKAPQPS